MCIRDREYEIIELLEAKSSDVRGTQSKLRDAHSEARGNHSKIRSSRPAIHQATLDGHIEKVKRMVERGTDINTRDSYGRTALHIASAENHNIDMQILIELGADINAQDKQGRTPLMYAAADGKKNAVALLVSKTADVNIKDVDGMRAYEWASSSGNAELAKFLKLITKGTSRADHQNRHIHTDYHHSPKKLEKSIQKEVEKAVQKEVKNAIKKEYEQRETFHIGTDGTHLKQFNIKETAPALLDAAQHGSITDCANLINNGLTVNSADDTGQTPLMVAARHNRLDIAKYLIEQGANVNSSSASGLTALHYAALENHHEMAQLLLNNKAKVDATMRYSSTDGNYGQEPLVWEYIGATPLLIATESKNKKVVSILLKAGANPNYILTRKEYRLNKNRNTYLTGSEVTGIDQDFLKEADLKISDNAWTPYKQALLLNDPAILSLLKK